MQIEYASHLKGQRCKIVTESLNVEQYIIELEQTKLSNWTCLSQTKESVSSLLDLSNQ